MRLIILMLLLCTPLSWAAELRELRVWESPLSTRVVFDLSGGIEHKVFTLENPARVVIDLHGLGPNSARVANAATGKGLVQKIRSAPRDNNALRVVLEVGAAVTPNSFSLTPSADYGHRLVVDLNPAESSPSAPVIPPPSAAPPAPARTPTPSAPRLEQKPIVIAIDAGHGGEDPGARGRTGLLEKDVALAMAQRLARLINAEPGMKAVLTRDGDYYLPHRERINIARRHQADLFVSVHANAFKDRSVHGSSVYVLSNRGASSEHARWLAQKENASDLVGGIEIKEKDNDLAAVLIDLSQSATMEASIDVGARILGAMGQINTLQRKDVQQAGFLVLKAPDIPSVLVETAFITNEKEERLLASEKHQDKFARSILKGIQGYFQSYRPVQQVAEQPGLHEVSYSAP